MLRTAERRKQRAEGRRGRQLGRTIDEDDFPEVVGDPDCRDPLEHLGKIVRDFLGVSAGGLVVWQRGSEAVEDPRPLNDVKMISSHDATMNELKPCFPSR